MTARRFLIADTAPPPRTIHVKSTSPAPVMATGADGKPHGHRPRIEVQDASTGRRIATGDLRSVAAWMDLQGFVWIPGVANIYLRAGTPRQA